MKTPAPDWKHPKREGYFDAPMAVDVPIKEDPVPFDWATDQGLRIAFDWATDQGSLAHVLRTVRGYLTYGVTFAAGWFASAVYSLARLKGWL